MFHKLHQSCYEVFARAAKENKERDNWGKRGTDEGGTLTMRGIQKVKKSFKKLQRLQKVTRN